MLFLSLSISKANLRTIEPTAPTALVSQLSARWCFFVRARCYGEEEARMRNTHQCIWHGAAKRCAICDGRFGLIRHYSCQTPLCSKKCADRFKARREDDRRWLSRLQDVA